MSILKKYFRNETNLTKKEVTYAKTAFIIEGSCNATASNFVGGAYLAAFFAFMTTDNYIVLKLISSVFMGIGYAGYGVSSFKYMFEVMPPERSASYIAGSSALSGITGYLASLVTTFVITVANGATFSILGITFSEMQILFIVSMLFSFLSVLFLCSKKK